jgi:hypothetical protein
MTIVTHRHCRELGYCNRGLREWFVREGLSWSDFLKQGIDAETLRAKNNAMVDRVIARAEIEHGQQ